MYMCIYGRKKIKMAAEKNFENKIKRLLSDHGCWYIKYWAGAKFTKDGIPDILVCCDGIFMAIEVKAKNGKPSLLQLVTLKKIREAGGIGVLLYPDDFKGFTEFLSDISGSKDWYIRNIELQEKWWVKLDT